MEVPLEHTCELEGPHSPPPPPDGAMQSPSWLAPSEVLPMASSVCTELPLSARSSTMSPFIQKAECQCLRGGAGAELKTGVF